MSEEQCHAPLHVNKFFDIGPDIVMVYAWFRSFNLYIVHSLKNNCSLVNEK